MAAAAPRWAAPPRRSAWGRWPARLPQSMLLSPKPHDVASGDSSADGGSRTWQRRGHGGAAPLHHEGLH
eukprot:14294138-Heterocapsa_arctica.AAC.1